MVTEADFVGEEPIPELGVIEVGVVNRVREIRLVELRVGER